MIVMVIALALWTRRMIIARKELLRAAWRRLLGKDKEDKQTEGGSEASTNGAINGASNGGNAAATVERPIGRAGRLSSIDESPALQSAAAATAAGVPAKGALGSSRRTGSRSNLMPAVFESPAAQRVKQPKSSIMLPPPTFLRPKHSSGADSPQPEEDDENTSSLPSFSSRTAASASSSAAFRSHVAEPRERNGHASEGASELEDVPPTATFPAFASNVPAPPVVPFSISSAASPSAHVAKSSLLGASASVQQQQDDLKQPLL